MHVYLVILTLYKLLNLNKCELKKQTEASEHCALFVSVCFNACWVRFSYKYVERFKEVGIYIIRIHHERG